MVGIAQDRMLGEKKLMEGAWFLETCTHPFTFTRSARFMRSCFHTDHKSCGNCSYNNITVSNEYTSEIQVH